MNKQITDAKYITYFYALKKVHDLHREYGFGKSPDIPSGFSESLCRHLTNSSKATVRSHDAISSDGKHFEFKATGTIEGKTTISNSNDFDILFWIFIEFDKNVANIYEMPRALFSFTGAGGRKSISLGAIAKSKGIVPTVYEFQQSVNHPTI